MNKKVYIRKEHSEHLNVNQLHDLFYSDRDAFNKYINQCYENHPEYYKDIIEPFLMGEKIPPPTYPKSSPKDPNNPGIEY